MPALSSYTDVTVLQGDEAESAPLDLSSLNFGILT